MRYERALELVVVVLLGAAGIAVAIAVYQRNSHQNAALWWALAMAAFLAAVLVPVVWLGVHPFFVWGRGKTAEWRIASAQRHVAQTERLSAIKSKAAPIPSLVVATDPTAALTIVHAVYGDPAGAGGSADVTERVRSFASANGGRLDFVPSNDTLGGDPAPNIWKSFTVRYEYGGAEHIATAWEGQWVGLP